MVPRLSVKSNVAQLARSLRIEREDLPKRVATALTRTAVEVRKGLQDEMRRVFDRPTRFTLNSLFLKGARANDLTAIVWLKDRGGLGRPHYLEPQIFGGARPLKPFEKRLQRARVLPVGMYAVPGEGAKLDSYGNMSRGQLVQILSQLHALMDPGGAGQSPSGSARSRRNVRRAGQFFAGRPGGGRMPLGVWQKQGKTLKPVLIFVRAPSYKARFKFYDVAERIARQQFGLQLERAHREALQRRGLRAAA